LRWPSLTNRRQLGQGGEGEAQQRDLRAELLQAEAAHFAKKRGVPVDELTVESAAPKRQIEGGSPKGGSGGTEDEDLEAKRLRILEETRDIDADSDGSEDDSSEEERLAASIRQEAIHADRI
jgi:protein CWC15